MFWQQIIDWVGSGEEEQPLLVAGAPEAKWDEFLGTAIDTLKLAPGDIVKAERESHTYKIKYMRELLAQISGTSFSGKRLVIIPEAERMRQETANALLKTLEESYSTNRFLLTTGYRSRLLETIVSRCRIVRLPSEFTPSQPEEIDAKSLFGQVAHLSRKQPLKEGEVQKIGTALTQMVSAGKTSPGITRALMRLKDYHKIKALGGNEKMASDVLVASLAQLRKNKG